jgi:hypothetical protein
MNSYALKPLWPALFAALVSTMIMMLAVWAMLTLWPLAIPSGPAAQELGLMDVDVCQANKIEALKWACEAHAKFINAWLAPSIRFDAIGIATAVFGAALLSFLRAYIGTPLKEGVVTRRGRDVTFGVYARRRIRTYIHRRSHGKPTALWLLPHVRLSAAQQSRNLLMLGGHGSGKTGWLRALIDQLVCGGSRNFILDVKGDVVEGLPTEEFILVAPADRRTWIWDLARDIRNRMEAAELVAKYVPLSDNDRFWGDGARAVWTDLIMHLVKTLGASWGWFELCAILLSPLPTIRAALAETNAPSASLLEWGADPEENRTIASIMLTLWVAALTQIVPLARAWKRLEAERRFSLRQWVSGRGQLPSTIVLQLSPEYPQLSQAIGAAMIDMLTSLILSPANRGNHQSYAFVLDEFPELGAAATKLPKLLNLGREANVTTIAALQDLGQLERIYGAIDARLIEARLGIRCIMRLEDGATVKKICEEWIGIREIDRRRESTVDELKGGLTKRTERIAELAIDPSVLSDELGVFEEGDRLTIHALIHGFGTEAMVEVPMTIWPARRLAFEPARWLDAED